MCSGVQLTASPALACSIRLQGAFQIPLHTAPPPGAGGQGPCPGGGPGPCLPCATMRLFGYNPVIHLPPLLPPQATWPSAATPWMACHACPAPRSSYGALQSSPTITSASHGIARAWHRSCMASACVTLTSHPVDSPLPLQHHEHGAGQGSAAQAGAHVHRPRV